MRNRIFKPKIKNAGDHRVIEEEERIEDIKFNILLFDEIFDSLDDENIGYVSKVLKVLARKKTIFIISHRHVDQLEADEVFQLN